MIVKNESRVIARMLSSVLPLVDSYCICDTGSTDNTVDIITAFFGESGIPGKIVYEPFRDFGHNRTVALQACEDMPDADYLLLMDADMVLEIAPGLDPDRFKCTLVEHAYHFFQGNPQFYYKNVRIVKNRIGATYWGVTHEYVNLPPESKVVSIPKGIVFINDVGDGGSKGDKFERDLRLLKQGLVDSPDNVRYTFYLAQTLRDNGRYAEAIEYYKRRITLGGWMEEVWYSYYASGLCYQKLGDMPNAIYQWMEAYQYFPDRLENLKEIVEYYRVEGKNNLSYMFCNTALKRLENLGDREYLFMNKDVYDYRLFYEMSVLGYYCNPDNHDLGELSHRVLNYPYLDEGKRRNTLCNYKFYAKQMPTRHSPLDEVIREIGHTIVTDPDFVGSTPSVVYTDTGAVVCRRFVNYRINAEGGYDQKDTVATINVICVLKPAPGREERWVVDREFVMDYDRELDGRYEGLEDVRLFSYRGRVLFMANRGIANHNMMIEHGEIDLVTERTVSGFVTKEGQRMVEKNWVLFEDARGEMRGIYDWFPLVVGSITEEADEPEPGEESVPVLKSFRFNPVQTVDTPGIFRQVRGSTNGVRLGKEVWFVCHLVSYEDRRYYYHLFVVLDGDTYALKRYTRLFNFTRFEKVEYVLGLQYNAANAMFLLTYSVMDRESKSVYVSKYDVEKMLV